MAQVSSDAIIKGIGAGAVGFGVVALASPDAFGRLFAIAPTDPLRFLTRAWGTRTALLGAYGIVVSDPATRKTMMTGTVALNAVDAAVALVSGGSTTTRVRAASASAAFAAAALYARSTLPD